MIFGILCGFATAILNTAGYFCSSGFLVRYKSPGRMLVMAAMVMMIVSLLFLPWIFPFGCLPSPVNFTLQAFLGSALFLLGQGAFFAGLRVFGASRISSLLGLKIVVLSFIFIISGGNLNWMQCCAVVMAAGSAVIFNWSGGGKVPLHGWLLLMVSLVCYSLVDMVETSLVIQVSRASGFSTLRSALATVPFLYTALGILLLPGLWFFKPDKEQLCRVTPYAILWLSSQVLLFCCFSRLQPVFGNVILATRGIFSVIAGILLSRYGFAETEAGLSWKMWLRRIVAALVMLGAIGLYSAASL
ncbi:MAG: hypothetical protein IKC82_01360 [Lentisphaeria bacterium]|nr:hypothetical protein [Lentisphaeria bacterium]